MKFLAKLIHKSYMSYLPTRFSVQYYGLPDGKVYLFYARLYEIKYDRSYLEYVFAVHNDFIYDYEKQVLVPKMKFRSPVYNEMVDNPNPDITTIKVSRKINSYTEAFELLNDMALEMKNGLNPSLIMALDETRSELAG
ncbi:MAG: hypothetical protein ABFS16_04485 [Bacteroidota bacterium]